MDNEKQMMLWKTAAGGDIQALLEMGFHETGCSMLLGDPILSVTGVACNMQTDGWQWEDFIRAGFAPELSAKKRPKHERRIVFTEEREGWLGIWPKSGAHLLLDLHTAKGNRFHLCISAPSLGQLEEALPFVDILSEAILVLLVRYETDTNSRLPMELFLSRLLEGSLDEEEMLQGRARLIDFPTEGIFSLLTVDLRNYMPRKDSLAAVADQLGQGIRHASTVRGSRMVVLCVFDSEEAAVDEKWQEKIRVYLKQNGLTAAQSRTFFILRDLPFYYGQTKQMLKIRGCMPPDALLVYPKMALHLIAAGLPAQDQSESAAHPYIRKLLALDEESHFGYLETLRAYLACSQRAQLACQMLHIHRNTLDYRLKKIEEKIPVEWTDGELMHQLYLSIRILETAGLISLPQY